MTFRALKILDELQQLAALEAFESPKFLDALAAEVAELPGVSLDEIGRSLDALRALFADVDRFTGKSVHIHIVQSFATVPQQMRALLVGTLVNYAADLALLDQRISPALLRADPSGDTRARLLAVAERVLAMRAELRAGIFALAGRYIAGQLPAVQKASRDRSLDARERERWGQLRIDLEQLTAKPITLEANTFAERMLKIPPPADEPDPDPLQSNRFAGLDID
jgi:hypothetical protein